MRRAFILIESVMLGLIVAGCRPSLEAVVEMRDTFTLPADERQSEAARQKAARKAQERGRKDLATLMVHFGQPQSDDCWRAEAMTSMIEIDQALQCPQTDVDSHAKVKALLLNEYGEPRLKPSAATDIAIVRLRGWSVHSLGKLSDPDLDSFFVDTLAAEIGKDTIAWGVELAAFDALTRRTERLGANEALRNRLLSLLPRLTLLLDRCPSNTNVELMRRYVAFFEKSVKTYDAVVELVPAVENQRMPDDELLICLSWNYQNLAAGRHREPGREQLFARNVARLLSLAWHANEKVRVQARIILAEFAPLELFAAATQNLGRNQNLLAEDCELLANLLPIADKVAATDAQQPKRRQDAVRAVFARIGSVPVQSREVVYARLLAHDPRLLREHLLAGNARAFNEGEKEILQQIRYLRRLRKQAAGGDPELAAAVASFAGKRLLPVRNQVVGELVSAEPRTLAAALAPVLGSIATEDAAQSKFLTSSYVDCLESIERAGKNADAGGAAPFYEHLAYPLARPELEITKKVVDFLAARDPNRLVTMLTDKVRRTASKAGAAEQIDYAILGDTTQRLLGALNEPTLRSSLEALATGLRSGNEEQVLLCCRYLLELNATVPAEQAATLPASVQVLLQVAAKGAVQGAQP